VGRGVQIVGGCCGIELEHIRPLREALPQAARGVLAEDLVVLRARH